MHYKLPLNLFLIFNDCIFNVSARKIIFLVINNAKLFDDYDVHDFEILFL